ncbi:MAG: symmetrical bis(5'-nucleosyl)-tetraphosphatase [Deltaproteobacteria bacterium]|nr:symmetrical bis(5'-nucleosyl)-tetraphosphatase [Deltaproteobacteria bacterium]
MSTYAIGDIQGCYLTLTRLLEQFAFDPTQDRLWLVGDLVNRGPRSLEVLRWARALGDRVVAVLGNHDLHLMARYHGVTGEKKRDTLDEILAAPDRDSLIDWLRHRPLFHREGNLALVHGGLDPAWDIATSEALAEEAQRALSGKKTKEALAALYSGKPDRWNSAFRGSERLRAILNIFTRIRVCRSDGRLNFEFKGAPEASPSGYFPWYSIPERKGKEAKIVFGHWAALGLRILPEVCAIDSGCVWGRSLSALRLEDGTVFQEPCVDFIIS